MRGLQGLENLCIDIEFMLGIKTSWYWRVCWSIVTPAIMITVFMYTLITTESLVFGDGYVYPNGAYVAGTLLQYAGIALIPIFIMFSLWKYRSGTLVETVKRAFRKKASYGPADRDKFAEYQEFRKDAKLERDMRRDGFFQHIGLSLSGGYRKSKY
ncbi:unnamed protein product [Plutella xylostella]|uniref:Sodium-dependent nutrient amino acid transporter 1 n=1 Tax=Plutella xylostella TaxID=51655 RepID=A0A8S4FYR8_PLUXY|nr:unnamed protein product [Plutella xylostella]